MGSRPPEKDADNLLLESEIERQFDGIRVLLSENRLREAADVLCEIYNVAPYDHFKRMYNRTLDILEDHMVRMMSADVTYADPSPLIEPAGMIRFTSPDMDDDLFFDIINRIHPHVETMKTMHGCVDLLNLMNTFGRCMFSVETFLPKLGDLCSRMSAICDTAMNRCLELDEEEQDEYLDAAVILVADVKSFYCGLGNKIEETICIYDDDVLEHLSDRWDDSSDRPYMRHIDDAYLASVSLNHLDEASDLKMIARRDYGIMMFIKTYFQ